MADGNSKTFEDSLGEAYDAIKARDADAEPVVAPTPDPEPEAQPDAAPEGDAGSASKAPEGETAEQRAERLRAEDGKFRAPTRAEKKAAKKTESAPASPSASAGQPQGAKNAPTPSAAGLKSPQPESAKPEGADATGAQPNTDQNPTGLAGVNPPAGWPAAAKAAFASLPPAVQAAVSRREQEVAQGFAQYEGIGKALAPVNQQLAMRGIPPQAYINQMVQLDLALQNPATRNQAWAYLAQSYGIPLTTQQQTHADPTGQGASNPGGGMPQDPTIAALYQRTQSLENFILQQQTAQRAQAEQVAAETQRQASTDVETFRNDPANEFFDLVRDDIRGVYERALVLNQKAPTLKEAYDAACWANRQVRPVMLARQNQEAENARVKAAADAAAKARKSGPVLRGTNGAQPASNAGPRKSLEEEMAEVYDRITAD